MIFLVIPWSRCRFFTRFFASKITGVGVDSSKSEAFSPVCLHQSKQLRDENGICVSLKKNSHCCSQHLLTLCILFVPGQRVFQRRATSWCSGRKLERPTISRCRSNPFKRELLKLDGCFFWGWRCLFSIWCHICKMKWWSNVMMKWVFFNIFQSDLLTVTRLTGYTLQNAREHFHVALLQLKFLSHYCTSGCTFGSLRVPQANQETCWKLVSFSSDWKFDDDY